MRTLSAFLLLLATASAMSAVNVTHQGDQTIYDFQIEKVIETQVEVNALPFIELTLKGIDEYNGIRHKLGEPTIPVIRFDIEGEGELAVSASKPLQRATNTRSLPLIPGIKPVPRMPGARPQLEMKNSAYGQAEFLPKELYTVQDLGSTNGKKLRRVTLYPLQYNAVTKSYQLRNHLRVIHRGKPRNLVEQSQLHPNRKTILFLTGPQFRNSPALRRYIAFKKSLGYETEMMIVTRDNQDAKTIREGLRSYYGQHRGAFHYLIIVGDVDQVPGFDSDRVDGVTDNFYRSLDTEDYERDLAAPEIYVGRFSAESEEDLANIVHNNIRYTTADFKQTEWLTRGSTIASDDQYWWPVAEGTMNFLILNYLHDVRYTGNFPQARMRGGDRLYAITHKATTEDVLRESQAGRGFITYGGHGYIEEWSGPEFLEEHIEQLNHDEALPMVSSHACYTGHFVEHSFAEMWQRKRGGAIMFWAATDSDYWNEGDYSQRRFYEAIFRFNLREFGKIATRTARDTGRYYGEHWYADFFWELYHLFGDPSVEFRTDAPLKATVTGPTSYDGQSRSLQFKLQDADEQPIEGVRAGLVSADGSFHEIKYTNEEGIVEFQAPETTNRFLTLSFSGHKVRLLRHKILVK